MTHLCQEGAARPSQTHGLGCAGLYALLQRLNRAAQLRDHGIEGCSQIGDFIRRPDVYGLELRG